MQFDFKKIRFDLLAIVLFLILSFAYCYPQLQGKKLNQHDNINWQGMAREGMQYHDSTGKDVLWSNSMFGGMPTYTTYVGCANTNYVGYVQTFLEVVGKPAYFFFIAMLCFYLLVRVLGVNNWLGIVGAVAYAFASYNAIIIGVGHDTKMLTMAYLPAALAGIYLIYQQKWWSGAAITGIAFGLIFTNNHFQVIYYSIIMFLCFGIAMFFIALKQGKIKEFFISSGVVLVITLIGIGPSMTSIFTTSEYTSETMRGGNSELSGHDKKANGGLDKDYAFAWSNGIGETFCLMVPYLYGGSNDESLGEGSKTYQKLVAIGVPPEKAEQFCSRLPIYWGPQPFIGGPVYFGAIICFLFVFALLIMRSPHKWWILIACSICIIMSWGKHFAGVNYFLFDHVPMLNKFRTPSMILVIPQFLFPLLGVLGINELIKGDFKKEWLVKRLLISTIITGGICLIIAIGSYTFINFKSANDEGTRQQFSSMFLQGNNKEAVQQANDLASQLVSAIQADRAPFAANSALISTLFIILAALCIWGFILKFFNVQILIAALGLLVVIDLVMVDTKYLSEKNYADASDYDEAFKPRMVDTKILADTDPYYRVLDLTINTYNDAKQAWFHKCIGGYHPAKMEIYQDLIDNHLGRKGYNREVLNMLNAKYIIGGQAGREQVMKNPDACGNAWFVDEIKWVNTADEEMNGLKAPQLGDTANDPTSFNPRKTALIRSTFKTQLGEGVIGKDSAAFVKLAKYGLDDISFTSNNSKEGLAVFSDIYYSKGWKATIDGKEVSIVKADYVLRAIRIPKGSHTIEFHFRPDSFYKGRTLAMVSSILLILICCGAVYFTLIKNTKKAD